MVLYLIFVFNLFLKLFIFENFIYVVRMLVIVLDLWKFLKVLKLFFGIFFGIWVIVIVYFSKGCIYFISRFLRKILLFILVEKKIIYIIVNI